MVIHKHRIIFGVDIDYKIYRDSESHIGIGLVYFEKSRKHKDRHKVNIQR